MQMQITVSIDDVSCRCDVSVSQVEAGANTDIT